MGFIRVHETDLFGRFCFNGPSLTKFVGYYAAVAAVRPLLAGDEWRNAVTGYYVNVSGDYNAVRVSYFSKSPQEVLAVVDSFVANVDVDHVNEPERPHRKRISEQYGGEELRFRRFLSTYAPICLDIMAEDLLHARCLAATLRWQVNRSPFDYRAHLLPTFQAQSQSFLKLDDDERQQLWEDLSCWPNPQQFDWAHFLVNTILGCDWAIDRLLEPRPFLVIAEINRIVADQGFEIPLGWGARIV